MIATSAAPDLKLTTPSTWSSESTRPVLVNGQLIRRDRRSSSRLLFRHGEYLIKVGLQGKYEVALWGKLPAKDRPYFWPIEAHGKVEGDHEKRVWVAQRILPLKQALETYDVDEWSAAFKVIQEVGARHGVEDLDFSPLPTRGAPVWVHNWTIYQDTPVIFDYGI